MRNIHPNIEDANRLGITFKERVRRLVEIVDPGSPEEISAWLAVRTARHRSPDASYESIPRSDATWLFHE